MRASLAKRRALSVPKRRALSLVKSLPHRTRGGASFLMDEEWLRSGDSRMRSGDSSLFSVAIPIG